MSNQLGPQTLKLLQELAANWKRILDATNRVLNMRGDGVTNTAKGIVVATQSSEQVPPKRSSQSSLPIRLKVKTASDANGVAVCNTWDGATLGTEDIRVRVAVPAKVDALIFAQQASPNAGVTATGAGYLPQDIAYIEHVEGDTSTVTGGLIHTDAAWGTDTDNTGGAFYVVDSVGWDSTAKQLFQMQRTVWVNSRGLIYKMSAASKVVIDTAVSNCADGD